MKIENYIWGIFYDALPSRAAKKSFREQFKFTANIKSDSHFRNLKNGHRTAPPEAIKFANDFFAITRDI